MNDSQGTDPDAERGLTVQSDRMQTYDPYRKGPAPYKPNSVTVYSPTSAEMTEAGALARALQTVIMQQSLIMREFDQRLRRLESRNQQASSTSFERATWWMLWGILMLIVGSALTVILLLIFSRLMR